MPKKFRYRLILAVWLSTVPFFYLGSVVLREATLSTWWRLPVGVAWFWTVSMVSRLATCFMTHEVHTCHNHVGAWPRSRMCWLIDTLTLGAYGHDWNTPYSVKIRGRSALWRRIVFWPLLYEVTVVIRGVVHDEVVSQRVDLPMPSRMNAVCRRCHYLWLVDKEMPLIERIAMLEHVREEDVGRLMFEDKGKNQIDAG